MAYHVRRAGHVSAGDILFIKNEMKSKKEGQGRKKGSVFATGTTTASLHTHPDKSSKARRRRRKGKKVEREKSERVCTLLECMNGASQLTPPSSPPTFGLLAVFWKAASRSGPPPGLIAPENGLQIN